MYNIKYVKMLSKTEHIKQLDRMDSSLLDGMKKGSNCSVLIVT